MVHMSDSTKADLHRYLQEGRDAIVWKLADLSEYDVRRPLTPTGTNLLGLVKHLAGVEAEYFGLVFDRPFGEDLRWLSPDAQPNEDMWAQPDESRDAIVGLYRRVWAPTRRFPCYPWMLPVTCRGGGRRATRSASAAFWFT